MPPPPTRALRVTWALLAAALLIPLGLAVGLPRLPPRGGTPTLHASPVSHFPPSPLAFDRWTLGPEPGYRPQITHVKIVDLDGDGLLDVIACDGRRNRVLWYRQRPPGGWDEIPLGDELNCPVGATVVDLDGDGDLDVLVPVLGSIWPTDERVGQVVWLENRGDGKFTTHVLLDDLRRVSDVQAADLDGDGDLDLAVAEFGYDRGSVLWLENRGSGKFRDHLLFATQGPSHVPIADLDGDGRPDIVALVSQEHEEVWAFENKRGGVFEPRLLHGFLNFDLGGAGLTVADVNRDGRPDLVVSTGDNLETNYHYPQPWHGCYWLENLGGWAFEPHVAARVGGVYAAAVADLDGDGDKDIVAACMFNDWRTPGSASLVWLENDGKQNFTVHQIADRPSHLATLAVGDLDGDGRPDVVAGSLHLQEPFDRLGRITVWFNRGRAAP
jgi:hypothetical protein